MLGRGKGRGGQRGRAEPTLEKKGNEKQLFRLGVPVSREKVVLFFRSGLQGNTLLNWLEGILPEPLVEPDPADYVAGGRQMFCQVDYKEYKEKVEKRLCDHLKIIDYGIASFPEDFADWIYKRHGEEVVKSRVIPPPPDLFIDWILEALYYKPGQTDKEKLKALVDRQVAMRRNGMYASETIRDFHKRFKDLFDLFDVVDPTKTPDPIEQASDFVGGLHPQRFQEFKAKFLEAEASVPADDAGQASWQVFSQMYGRVWADNLTEAYEKARDFKPTWQALARDHDQVVEEIHARIKVEEGAKKVSSTEEKSEPKIKCDLCDGPHGVRQCRGFARAKQLYRADLKKPLLKADGTSNPFFDFEFPCVTENEVHEMLMSAQKMDLTKVIGIFDTCSSLTVFCDDRLVQNKRNCDPLHIRTAAGIYNGVSVVGDSQYFVPEVYFDQSCKINVICAHEVFNSPKMWETHVYSNGEVDFKHVPSGTTFEARWHRKVLVVDITQMTDK